MRAWKLLFVPDHRFVPDTSKDATWNRGAYLVEPLGHCGECHTPRDLLQGLDDSRKFAGTKQVGWLAYNLTSDPIMGSAAGATRNWRNISRPATPKGADRRRGRWRRSSDLACAI